MTPRDPYVDSTLLRMNKPELRRMLHKLNPFADYLGSYGVRMTKAQLIDTVRRHLAVILGSEPEGDTDES